MGGLYCSGNLNKLTGEEINMGQAKQRGTREQRLARKLGLVERSLDELKRDLNIPDSAEFIGYGLHIEASDEFLASFEDHGGLTKKMWVKLPEQAQLFMELASAYEMQQKCIGAVMVGIFETEENVWVAVIG